MSDVRERGFINIRYVSRGRTLETVRFLKSGAVGIK